MNTVPGNGKRRRRRRVFTSHTGTRNGGCYHHRRRVVAGKGGRALQSKVYFPGVLITPERI